MYLHCNFWNLRDRNLAILGAPGKREEVAKAVEKWDGLALEEALFAGGGCGSFVRSEKEWRALPQMQSVSGMPLLEIIKIGDAPPQPLPAGDRPLSSIRTPRPHARAGRPNLRAHARGTRGGRAESVAQKDLADRGAVGSR